MTTRSIEPKECTMTVFMHDYAFPDPIRIGIFGLGGYIPRRPQDIQLYDHLTMEFVRESTPEQLGMFIKMMLSKVDKSKQILEDKITL